MQGNLDMNVKIESFTENDKNEVLRLLSESELPTEDLTTEKLKDFLVAQRQDDTVIGAIGIELKQDIGLLRSLVVHPHHRKCGIGKLLVNELESIAQEKGVKALYLLTTTAADFFLGLGYRVTLRKTVPKNIADTEEFKGICPTSSVCLYKKLTKA
jgi:amino-acid N-acetyltransferase